MLILPIHIIIGSILRFKFCLSFYSLRLPNDINNNRWLGCDPGITEPGIIVRPWLFLLLKEGCGRNSYNLEYPQAYTITNLLLWHRHHDWGDLGLFVQVSSEGPVAHSYILIAGCLPGVTPTTFQKPGSGRGHLTGPGIEPGTSIPLS